MPTSRVTGPLPPDIAARVRAYLGAFLAPEQLDDAVEEVAADARFWGDTAETDILAVAHGVLASHLRVATDVEVLVLNDDVGLSVPEIGAVLGLPPTEVRRTLDDALAVLAEPEAAPPSPAPTAAVPAPVPEPRPGAEVAPPTAPAPAPIRQGRPPVAVLVAAVVVVVAAIVVAWVLRDAGGPSPRAATDGTPVVATAGARQASWSLPSAAST